MLIEPFDNLVGDCAFLRVPLRPSEMVKICVPSKDDRMVELYVEVAEVPEDLLTT